MSGGRDRSRLTDILTGAEAGDLDGDDDVMVRIAWLRAEAAGRVAPDWEEGFTGMLDYAERKGWLDEERHAVRAHIEWASNPESAGDPESASNQESAGDR